MPSLISTQGLVNNVMRFLSVDTKDKALVALVKEAIKDADRELRTVDAHSPLAWDIHPYDELRTITYGDISALTAVNPGVATAQSRDSNITGTGMRDPASYGHKELITIDGIVSDDDTSLAMDNLNRRTLIATYASATTFSMKHLDDLNELDTSGYDSYSSGGAFYHAGFVLDATTIEADLDNEWEFDRIISVTFDGYPATSITQNQVMHEQGWTNPSNAQRPKRWRYWQNITTSTPTLKHYLFWYPVCDTEYQVKILYKKNIPDISTWNTSTYPFHPAEVHDAIWHGALAELTGLSKRMERQTNERLTAQVEVMFAEKWIRQWEKDKKRVLNLSRSMLGDRGGMGGISA